MYFGISKICHCQCPTGSIVFIRRFALKPTSRRGGLSSFNNGQKKKLGKVGPVLQQLVSASPLKLQPYLRLSRVDAPIGTWLLFWPCTWGLSLGSTGIPSLESLGLFGIGAFLMRGAGCTINDMWDRDFDACVTRTRNRPLASGEISHKGALGWLGIQLSLSLLVLLQLPAPCYFLGVSSLVLVALYPLSKRVTNWPQAVLGLTFNTGILFGYSTAVGADLGFAALPWLTPSVLTTYGAAVAWTLLYDTIYAHQDREEDGLLGLGSTACRFGDNTKIWLSGFATTMIGGLGIVGVLSDLSWPYYTSLSVAAAHLIWQIWSLDINNRENCARRFRSNHHLGWIICSGIVASKFIVS